MTQYAPHVTICRAKSKRTHERCQRPAMKGRELCYHHGGKSLVGIANPAFTTGRYSKHLPSRLAARYDESRSDTELLALREDIALIDSRLADVLGRVDTGESGEKWRQLTQAAKAYRQASMDNQADCLAWILALIEVGTQDYAAWNDVRSLLQERCKLVESERKRYVEMGQMITADRAMVLLAQITDIIRRNVVDKQALAAISSDLGRLVSVGADTEPRRIK